jgi:hypothetical protein
MTITIRAVADSGGGSLDVPFTVLPGDSILALLAGRGTAAALPGTVTWDAPGVNEALTVAAEIVASGGTDRYVGILYHHNLTPGSLNFSYNAAAANDRCYIMALTGMAKLPPYDTGTHHGDADSDVADYALVALDHPRLGFTICHYVTGSDDNHTEAGDGTDYDNKWTTGTPTCSIATYTAVPAASITMRYNSSDVAQCMAAASWLMAPDGWVSFF